jgi:hypothetical protein
MPKVVIPNYDFIRTVCCWCCAAARRIAKCDYRARSDKWTFFIFNLASRSRRYPLLGPRPLDKKAQGYQLSARGARDELDSQEELRSASFTAQFNFVLLFCLRIQDHLISICLVRFAYLSNKHLCSYFGNKTDENGNLLL